MAASLDDLIRRADLDELVRFVDSTCDARDWELLIFATKLVLLFQLVDSYGPLQRWPITDSLYGRLLNTQCVHLMTPLAHSCQAQ
jgi:hypothetical protein